mmetsp:Transcript_179761/g.570132  ORF Transcript_179761/g.570132 Transcript_179761/m.570132 type:complete len:531 (-) Transcript_179761:115-1707(-)
MGSMKQHYSNSIFATSPRRTVAASHIAGLITREEHFAKGQQADAHEALIFILTQLLAGCVSVGDGTGKPFTVGGYAERELLEMSSLVGNVFGMELGQTVRCKRCGHESTSSQVEYCMCLTITLGLSGRQLEALQWEASQLQLGRGRLGGRSGGGFGGSYGGGSYGGGSYGGYSSVADADIPDTSIEEMIEEYTKAENIDGWSCEKCPGDVCQRAAHVARIPNTFLVYIDRRQDAAMYGKINRRVHFRQRLDLSPFCRGRGRASSDPAGGYSLYGVIVHRDVNRSTFCGHYVAYVRDHFGSWHVLDDTSVEPVSWSTVQDQHPYLLFYSADVLALPQGDVAIATSSASTSAKPPASTSRLAASAISSITASTRSSVTAATSRSESEVSSRATSSATDPIAMSERPVAVAASFSSATLSASLAERNPSVSKEEGDGAVGVGLGAIRPSSEPEPAFKRAEPLVAAEVPAAELSVVPRVAAAVETEMGAAEGAGGHVGAGNSACDNGIFDFDELEEAEARAEEVAKQRQERGQA